MPNTLHDNLNVQVDLQFKGRRDLVNGTKDEMVISRHRDSIFHMTFLMA